MHTLLHMLLYGVELIDLVVQIKASSVRCTVHEGPSSHGHHQAAHIGKHAPATAHYQQIQTSLSTSSSIKQPVSQSPSPACPLQAKAHPAVCLPLHWWHDPCWYTLQPACQAGKHTRLWSARTSTKPHKQLYTSTPQKPPRPAMGCVGSHQNRCCSDEPPCVAKGPKLLLLGLHRHTQCAVLQAQRLKALKRHTAARTQTVSRRQARAQH